MDEPTPPPVIGLALRGAVLGTAWAFGSFLLLVQMPHFLLLEARLCPLLPG